MRNRKRSGGLVGGIAVGAIGLLFSIPVSLPARAHVVSAQFAGTTCHNGIPCDEDHLAGSYQVGVPGVDANYVTGFTSANSATGHLVVDGSYSWLEGAKPSSITTVSSGIGENGFLHRINPGPASVRVSLDLRGDGQATASETATTVVELHGAVSFGGCQTSASRTIFPGDSGDLELDGGSCGTLEGSRLTATIDYPANVQIPTNPNFSAGLTAEYLYLYLSSVTDYQWQGDFTVELTNLSADWDTDSFLTQVPEPGAATEALSAIVPLAMLARRRREGWES